MNKSQKILIWGNNWIGDVICSLPAVNALREKYPESRIAMVVRSPSDEILHNHPSIDQVIPLNKRDGLLTKIKLILYLRKEKFHIAFAFPNSFRSALMVFFTGARERIGYNKEYRGVLLTQAIRPPDSRYIHLSDYFLGIVKYAGCDGVNLDTKIGLDKDDLSFADNYIKGYISNVDNVNLLCIHPGASKPQRAWNIEKFGKLCSILSKKYRTRFIVIGNKQEYEIFAKLQDYLQEKIIFACSNISLSRIAALIKRCSLFIGNDSGIMHIASALGIPVVAIFGPDIPERTGPFVNRKLSYSVTKRFACSPCRQRFFKDCKPSVNNKALCIESIDLEDIIKGVEEINSQLMIFKV